MPTGYKGTLPGEVRRGLSLRFPFTNTVDMVNSGVTAFSGNPTIQGGVYNAEGKTAYFDFDSPNDQGGWNASGFTVSFWMKIAHSSLDGTYCLLVNSNGTSPDNVGGMYIIPADFGAVTNGFYIACGRGLSGGDRYGANVSNVISDNVWEHFTFILDNGAFFLYKNGSPVNMTDDSSGSGTGYKPNIGTWRFGADKTDGSGTFTGQVHDFRMYGTVLSASEILDVYNVSQLSFFGNTYALWLFDEKSIDATNNRILDLSGNGRHLRRGDGSTTTTFPTKMPRAGYLYDGGDYFYTALSGISDTAGTFTVRVNITGTGVQIPILMGQAVTQNSLYISYDSLGVGRVVTYNNVSTPGSIIGSVPIPQGTDVTLSVSWDASSVFIYLNGKLFSSGARLSNTNFAAVANLWIGQSGLGSLYQTGNISGAALFTSVLTPMQQSLLHEYLKANSNRT